MKGSEKGKKIVKRMVDEINEELRQYDYEDAMSSSDDEEDNEGFKDFLGGLGIDLS